MDQAQQLDLLILIAIRNNDEIPTDEFHTLFDHDWHIYNARFKALTLAGFFTDSAVEQLPGTYRYELTKKGKHRITELLNERSNEISVKLIQLKYGKGSSPVPGWNIFSGLQGFLSLISSLFKRKHSGERELTH